MFGLIFGVVVVLVVISRLRKLAGEFQSGPGAERVREVRSRIVSASEKGENFSLQQVLAEIEKVKEQARRQPATAAASREQLRARIETARRDPTPTARESEQWRALGREPPAQERTGPLGRLSSRTTAPVEEVEEGQDFEASLHIAATPADTGPPGNQPIAAQPSVSPEGARFKVAELRNALVWREILGPPVSLRDE